MREYYGPEQWRRMFGLLPSFRKLLWWFIRTAKQCNYIKIFVVTDPLGGNGNETD